MALTRNRNRISVKGLGKFEIRKTEPTSETSFSDLGYLKTTTVNDTVEMDEVIDELGNLVGSFATKQTATITTQLQQTSKDEIDLLKNAVGQTHSVRYKGFDGKLYKQFVFDKVVISPKVEIGFQAGERILNLTAKAIKQEELTYDVPLYTLIETEQEMSFDKCELYLAPYLGLNTETNKILDISGFARHGTISSEYLNIWQQGTNPKEYLSFDGSVDEVNFGNVCDITTEDFGIEAWVRIPTDEPIDTVHDILTKRNVGDGAVGYALYATDYLVPAALTFKVSVKDGSGTQKLISSTAGDVNDDWYHVFAIFDRDGNGTVYKNGVAGTPVAISSVSGSLTNTTNLLVAARGVDHGKVDVGIIRFYNFGNGGLPSNIATIISNHYNGEKFLFGL